MLRSGHFDAAKSLRANTDFHFATDAHGHRLSGQSMNLAVSRDIIAVFPIRQLLFLQAGGLARRVQLVLS
ncbi:MAG: hypothetical protein EBS83_01150 [Planctomycetia bacterium]|nr:hypothetical protein [Planctomycetia bacterium]